MSEMNELVADFVLQMGLALPVAILVAIRAGKMIHTITSMNMETKITHLAVDVVKEKIVEKLDIILSVYRDTTL